MDELYETQGREPAFDAVIPAPVRYNDALTANAKLLYGEIRALSCRYGCCIAGNAYFAGLYQVTERTIARLIKQLAAMRYIKVVSTRDAAGHVNGRRIYVGCEVSDPADAGNFDALSPMTKLSALTDKNVSQAICESDVNDANCACESKREKQRAKKKKTDAEPRAELIRWARETFPGESDALVDALMRYCDMRCEKGWMMERVSTATRCEKRLMSLSKGNLPEIIAILEQSIAISWQDVYALKKDDPFWEGRSTPGKKETDEEWL